LLRIAFANLEQEPSPLTLEIFAEREGALFTGANAARILDFADKVSGQISGLMVHCDRGHSRLPAVTASLLGAQPKLLKGTSPNRLVYELLENLRENWYDWPGFGAPQTAAYSARNLRHAIIRLGAKPQRSGGCSLPLPEMIG
jgi:hypothetical protein